MGIILMCSLGDNRRRMLSPMVTTVLVTNLPKHRRTADLSSLMFNLRYLGCIDRRNASSRMLPDHENS